MTTTQAETSSGRNAQRQPDHASPPALNLINDPPRDAICRQQWRGEPEQPVAGQACAGEERGRDEGWLDEERFDGGALVAFGAGSKGRQLLTTARGERVREGRRRTHWCRSSRERASCKPATAAFAEQ